MATGDASHVLRISRRWRSCSSTVKIPSTANSVGSDISGQKCSTSAVGSDASAGLSQERIKKPVTTWATVGWCRLCGRSPEINSRHAWQASCIWAKNSTKVTDRNQSNYSERPGRRGLTRPYRSQGKTEPRSEHAPLRWPIGCVPRPAACGGVLCSRVASHATQTR